MLEMGSATVPVASVGVSPAAGVDNAEPSRVAITARQGTSGRRPKGAGETPAFPKVSTSSLDSARKAPSGAPVSDRHCAGVGRMLAGSRRAKTSGGTASRRMALGSATVPVASVGVPPAGWRKQLRSQSVVPCRARCFRPEAGNGDACAPQTNAIVPVEKRRRENLRVSRVWFRPGKEVGKSTGVQGPPKAPLSSTVEH